MPEIVGPAELSGSQTRRVPQAPPGRVRIVGGEQEHPQRAVSFAARPGGHRRRVTPARRLQRLQRTIGATELRPDRRVHPAQVGQRARRDRGLRRRLRRPARPGGRPAGAAQDKRHGDPYRESDSGHDMQAGWLVGSGGRRREHTHPGTPGNRRRTTPPPASHPTSWSPPNHDLGAGPSRPGSTTGPGRCSGASSRQGVRQGSPRR